MVIHITTPGMVMEVITHLTMADTIPLITAADITPAMDLMITMLIMAEGKEKVRCHRVPVKTAHQQEEVIQGEMLL
jgi:hypothetical protein